MKSENKSLPENDRRRITPVQIAILSVIVISAALCIVFILSGTLPSFVGIESDSMSPNLNAGDLVFIINKDRFGSITTGDQAEATGEMTFGGYGDVIVYHPNGNTLVTPLLHRVVTWVSGPAAVERYGFSPESVNSGYITKGDHNEMEDQTFAFAGVGRVYPVKEEWVVGKVMFAIPLIGYVPMYLWKIIAVLIIILLASELYSVSTEMRRKKGDVTEGETECRIRKK